MTKVVQHDCELVVDGHLRVSRSVDEDWIGADCNEDFVECDGIDAEPLLKQVVELLFVLVGCEDEGQVGRWSSVAKLSIMVIPT